ncbi:rod shape-determining protein MreC [Anaerobacterium chartisolvens]|uniref:Cell shape-determining protein MreC n=1 Tax=Anaerobacterium chartisolvens TaxID=1297424 RepID=A0A369BGY3_9FIRM|nr:rod shape-determining protein MreC [Anaerobacterium chartisolvens]RCX20810.1 rod shape-determining protein MreC [Anaerobacterium chartisolvens]
MLLRLLKNKVLILIAVTLSIFIVMGLSAGESRKTAYIGNALNVPLSPLQSFFSFIGDNIEGTFIFFRDMKSMEEENKELKAEIDRLENENRSLLRYREENKSLREALDLKNQFNDYKSIGGNIIAKDAGNWFNVFTIDRGSNEGITENSPVITSKGLIGSVIEAAPFSSKVLSIIDVDSTVSAVISKSTDIVKVRGDLKLKDQGLCRMDYIPAELELEIGDTVETTGLGGIFPRGILIGTVKEIRQEANELDRYAVIEPAADFKRLQEVFVLKSKYNNAGKASNGEIK